MPDAAGRNPPWAAGLSALVKFGLEESPVSPRWLAQVLELTACYPVSFYDAAYHATTLIHGGVFVTTFVQAVAVNSPIPFDRKRRARPESCHCVAEPPHSRS